MASGPLVLPLASALAPPPFVPTPLPALIAVERGADSRRALLPPARLLDEPEPTT